MTHFQDGHHINTKSGIISQSFARIRNTPAIIVTATGTYDQLVAILEDKASQSRTAKLWVDNLIKFFS